MNLFKKKSYIPVRMPKLSYEDEVQPQVPDGMWVKCKACGKTIYSKDINEFRLCPHCGGHFRLSAGERIGLVADEGSFQPFTPDLASKNPLSYPDYERKIQFEKEKSGLPDGVVTGRCQIGQIDTVLGVMDSNFMMGSMGSVVGEKLTRAFEYALDKKLPVVLFTASGGARMQEGIISLMQMAKVSAAVQRHGDAGLLYTTVITDPTTGGVTASFAMLGDIILSEPGAMIGFAGRRVIEQTIKQKLPEDFQTAEFLLEHGFIDKIVERSNLKDTLAMILRIHAKGGQSNG